MTVLATSPNQEKQEKRVLPIRTIGDRLREHTEGSTLNTSSIKSLNGNMSITPLVNMSSSSSSSSYADASDQQTTQETAKGENCVDFFESNAPPTDKQYVILTYACYIVLFDNNVVVRSIKNGRLGGKEEGSFLIPSIASKRVHVRNKRVLIECKHDMFCRQTFEV